MTLDEKKQRYAQLAHAVQTGVAYVLAKDPSEGTPKHLRTGVNMTMVEHSALALLLMKKGVITEDEYYDAVLAALEREVASYEAMIRRLYGADGAKIHLF